HSQSVTDVHPPHRRGCKTTDLSVLVDNGKRETFSIIDHLAHLPLRTVMEAEGREGFLRRVGDLQRRREVTAHHHWRASGHDREEPGKGVLHVFQIAINISVIELHRIQQYGLRLIMEEFGTFVEEGRIILVTFNHEEFACAELIATSEVSTN